MPPNPPSKAHGFDMHIPKFGEKILAPPLSNPGYAIACIKWDFASDPHASDLHYMRLYLSYCLYYICSLYNFRFSVFITHWLSDVSRDGKELDWSNCESVHWVSQCYWQTDFGKTKVPIAQRFSDGVGGVWQWLVWVKTIAKQLRHSNNCVISIWLLISGGMTPPAS